MNKKQLEIIYSIGSVALLTVLFILVHQTMQQHQEYGFMGALVAFIIITSLVGLKINQME
ncbi:hypothetical protein [Methanolobus halotolerans]|uniref:Uncharacterized protein n=1 Tax=Methanolobus halotolerans TaxID=2052935 RepID=A0A4E0QT46_9EURY|nr:hypothetical protein [Methanolobus halotolerans]TGC10981.1 hypothetical protein CUN85_02170 [Methanolobus halotolerans]